MKLYLNTEEIRRLKVACCNQCSATPGITCKHIDRKLGCHLFQILSIFKVNHASNIANNVRNQGTA